MEEIKIWCTMPERIAKSRERLFTVLHPLEISKLCSSFAKQSTLPPECRRTQEYIHKTSLMTLSNHSLARCVMSSLKRLVVLIGSDG